MALEDIPQIIVHDPVDRRGGPAPLQAGEDGQGLDDVAQRAWLMMRIFIGISFLEAISFRRSLKKRFLLVVPADSVNKRNETTFFTRVCVDRPSFAITLKSALNLLQIEG